MQILEEPQPYFEIIKRHYPHFLHRRARNGCPVWIELPTRINLPAIRASGVSDEALRRHYVFVTEYLWGAVEPDFDAGQVVTVLDVQGLGMRDLAGDALGFVKVSVTGALGPAFLWSPSSRSWMQAWERGVYLTGPFREPPFVPGVANVDGFPRDTPPLSRARAPQRATSIVQDHYVERSNRMFIINAPSYFSMIW